MKRVLSIFSVVIAGLIFNAYAHDREHSSNQSDLYVAILDLDENGYITCPEHMSLEDYALEVEKDEGQALRDEYPYAAFALVRYDAESGKLVPTDPNSEIKELKKVDPEWYDKEVRFNNIFKKTSKLFLKTSEVVMLWACWTTSYVLIPGSIQLYEHGSNLIQWLRENYFPQNNDEDDQDEESEKSSLKEPFEITD